MSGGSGSAAPSDEPSVALGGAWHLLDALPRSAAAPSMTSTTVEMVAAAVRPAPVRRSMWAVWIAPVATVAAAFLTGMVAGRVTLTDPDRAVLEYLPVIEHLDVLREAGSIEFLTAVARRNYPAPRRFGFSRPGEPGGDGAAPAYEALDASVAALTQEPFGDGASSGGARRDAFETGTADERRRVADAALEFQALSPTQRRDLVRLARALGGHDGEGPDRDELLAAARLWHEWLATRDPAERKGVIDLDTAERLEWLDRYTVPRPGIGRGGPFRGFQPPGARLPEGPPPQGSRFNGPPPDPRRPAPGGTPPPPR